MQNLNPKTSEEIVEEEQEDKFLDEAASHSQLTNIHSRKDMHDEASSFTSAQPELRGI